MAQYSDYLRYLQHVDDTTLGDIKASEEAIRKELQGIIGQKDQTIRKLKQVHSDEITRIKTDSAAELESVRQQYERAIRDAKEAHRNERDRLLSEKKKAELDNATALTSLKNSYDSKLSHLEKQYDHEKISLIEKHKSEIDRLNTEIKKVDADRASSIEGMRARYEAKLVDIESKMSVDKKEMELLHQKSVEQLQSHYNKEIADLNKKIEENKAAYEKTIYKINAEKDAVQLELQASCESARKHYEGRLTASEQLLEKEKKQLEDSFKSELEHLGNKYKKEAEVNSREIDRLTAKLSGLETGRRYKRLKTIAIILSLLLVLCLIFCWINYRGNTPVSRDAISPICNADTVEIRDTIYVDREIPVEQDVKQNDVQVVEKVVYRDNPDTGNAKKEIDRLNKVIREKDKSIQYWQNKYNSVVANMSY